MTRDDVIRMAREAGADQWRGPRGDDQPQLRMFDDAIMRFAALVAAHEREECAQAAESKLHKIAGIWYEGYDQGRIDAAEKIRAKR